MKIKIPKLKILKNNRWIFGSIIIFIGLVGIAFFVDIYTLNHSKKQIAGVSTNQDSNKNIWELPGFTDQKFPVVPEATKTEEKVNSTNNLPELKCKPVTLDEAIENVKKLPEIQKVRQGLPIVKDGIEYDILFEDEGFTSGKNPNDPHYHIREFHSERSIENPPKSGNYLQSTYNEYVVDKCTGKLITSRWLYDKNGNIVSYEENKDYLPYDSTGNYDPSLVDDNYTQTIFW